MPYELVIQKNGLYKVCKKDKTKCFSKKGIPKKRAIKQMKAIGMRGGAVSEYGSWDGDLKSWQDAGFPGCGLGMEYDPNGECYEGCAEKEEPFSCIAKSEAQKRRGDITKYSNNASVRTAIQDEDAMKRFLSIEIRKEDEDKAKKEVASAWEVPPVPKWDDIREIKDWNEVSNNYTGFVKMVVSTEGYDPKNPLTYNIAYYKNGKLVTSRLKPGAELKYKFDWDKIKQRWERIHPDSIFNPTNFATDRKNRVNIKGDNISGKFINFDSRGAEKFEAGYHGSLEYLNSVEGRHIREADPYFEELYLKLLEQNHGWEGRNEKEKKKFEADLEKDFIKEEKERYGNNKDIFSPEKNFTLKDRNGRSLRVNKVRLRKDGGYDIQFSNGTWEYQPGKDEWDCNEWKRGERLEDYGVCGTEGRKRASELKEKNINRERDQIWDGMSGWDKFVNGLAVAGAYTTDNIMPIASTVLSFVPGIGSTLSTIIDTAKNANDTILNLMGNPCRHFNECTERDVEAGKANSLYHRTKGDTVAENYLTDENWQKLLDDNEKVHPLIMDTVNYGSRAGKFVQTGSGKKSKELMDLLQNEIYTEFNPTKKVKKLNDLSLKFPEIGLTKELINEFKDRPYMIDKALLDIVMDLQKSGNGKPTNKKLYDEIKKEVYKKNKKHSLYRSALIQKIYKSKGGEYLEGKKKMNIDKWFNQKWISINDYLRGEIVQCGNSNTQEKYNEYPLCRPLKIAELMTKDEMKKLIAKKNKLKSKPVITEKVLGTKKLNIKPTMSGLGLNPIVGRIGGKSLLKKKIVDSYFPKNYENMTYVEPFVGGGSIFFYKNPSVKEIINDKDTNIYKIFKGMQKYRGEVISKDVNGNYNKKDYENILSEKPKSDYGKFIRLLKLFRLSFFSNIEKSSFGNRGKISTDFKDKYQDRLKNVEIFNEDYLNLIKKYDSPNTFFYLDPPYEKSEGLYKHSLLSIKDIYNAVKNIKGKFMISYNDSKEAKKLFKNFNIYTIKTRYTNPLKGGQDRSINELIITNYKNDKLKGGYNSYEQGLANQQRLIDLEPTEEGKERRRKQFGIYNKQYEKTDYLQRNVFGHLSLNDIMGVYNTREEQDRFMKFLEDGVRAQGQEKFFYHDQKPITNLVDVYSKSGSPAVSARFNFPTGGWDITYQDGSVEHTLGERNKEFFDPANRTVEEYISNMAIPLAQRNLESLQKQEEERKSKMSSSDRFFEGLNDTLTDIADIGAEFLPINKLITETYKTFRPQKSSERSEQWINDNQAKYEDMLMNAETLGETNAKLFKGRLKGLAQYDPVIQEEIKEFKGTKLQQALSGSSKFNFDKDKYLRIAKSTAKKAGYNPKLLKFSTNPKKKLNYNGIDFGASGYGDFIIYKLTDPKIADKKRENYRKRAKKVMSETNDKFSPASLSYYILW